jgi:hypothetical protein
MACSNRSPQAPRHATTIHNWTLRFLHNTIGPLPFRTIFGWRMQSIPTGLESKELIVMPEDVKAQAVELGWMSVDGQPSS